MGDCVGCLRSTKEQGVAGATHLGPVATPGSRRTCALGGSPSGVTTPATMDTVCVLVLSRGWRACPTGCFFFRSFLSAFAAECAASISWVPHSRSLPPPLVPTPLSCIIGTEETLYSIGFTLPTETTPAAWRTTQARGLLPQHHTARLGARGARGEDPRSRRSRSHCGTQGAKTRGPGLAGAGTGWLQGTQRWQLAKSARQWTDVVRIMKQKTQSARQVQVTTPTPTR